MSKKSLWVLLVLVLFLSACSSKPKYLSEKVQPSNISKLDLSMFESVVLYPSLEKSKGEFQYDLSVLDKSTEIVAAVLELPVASKAVFARSLGGAEAKDLAMTIRPTPYYGSRVKAPNVNYVQAYDSNMEFETGALSILERGGGTGGKTTYASKAPGVDKYDVTEMLKSSLSLEKPLTFSLTTSAQGMADRTIFSSSYKLSQVVLGKIGENNNLSRISIYYQ